MNEKRDSQKSDKELGYEIFSDILKDIFIRVKPQLSDTLYYRISRFIIRFMIVMSIFTIIILQLGNYNRINSDIAFGWSLCYAIFMMFCWYIAMLCLEKI
jgi:hypothetical protein